VVEWRCSKSKQCVLSGRWRANDGFV